MSPGPLEKSKYAPFWRSAGAALKAACYAAALTALGASFLSAAPADLQKGAYFDFSSGPGDITNSLSEPLDGPTFFALQDNLTDAELQAGGQKDQRVLDKIAPAEDTSRTLVGRIPIPGELKFTIYMTNGQADRSEEDTSELQSLAYIVCRLLLVKKKKTKRK